MLFPLCDVRGLVSQSLGCPTRRIANDALPGREAESIFFAWLLELPKGIDARAAARAMLLVSGEMPGEALQQQLRKSGASDGFRTTMIGLLQRVGTSGSLYESPEK